MRKSLPIVNTKLKQDIEREEVYLYGPGEVAAFTAEALKDANEDTVGIYALDGSSGLAGAYFTDINHLEENFGEAMSMAMLSNSTENLVMVGNKEIETIEEEIKKTACAAYIFNMHLLDYINNIENSGRFESYCMEYEITPYKDPKHPFKFPDKATDISKISESINIEKYTERYLKPEGGEGVNKLTAQFLIREELKQMDKEHLCVICYNEKNEPIGANYVSRGTVNSSFAKPTDILKIPQIMGASSIDILHNHPSRHLDMNEIDIDTTIHAKLSCDILGIQLNDSIIVAGGSGACKSIIEDSVYQKALAEREKQVKIPSNKDKEISPMEKEKQIKDKLNASNIKNRVELKKEIEKANEKGLRREDEALPQRKEELKKERAPAVAEKQPKFDTKTYGKPKRSSQSVKAEKSKEITMDK